ncbi:Uncaracterized surface protein containing fasciclin (FAS1) repeats [bacterium A37T11]|nr:Uncaracterized surface protein containing fasciclin (FAS1) repeats [bacterium A37T11]
MKINYKFTVHVLFAGCMLFFLGSCKKDKKNTEPQVTVEDVLPGIVSSLSKSASLATFSDALQDADLSDAEVSEGLTIFAVPDEELVANKTVAKTHLKGQKMAVSQTAASENTSFNIKDHLLKGLIKISDLVNGKTFTTLSGKQLLVYVADTNIFINGVEITNKTWASGEHDVVHVLSKSLTGSVAAAPGTLTVNVYDATKWATNKPKGELLEGATVDVYLSTDDFSAGHVAYTAQTDASGKAVFNRFFPGTYYLVGHKEGIRVLSSIFDKKTGSDGKLIGLGAESLIQNEQEVVELATNTPVGYAMVGNFKPVDANADGVIDNKDQLYLPYNSAEIEGSDNKSVDLIIGLPNNHSVLPITSAVEFCNLAEVVYYDVFNTNARWIVLDGVLSDEATCTNINMNGLSLGLSLCDADRYAYSPVNFSGLWNSHYDLLSRLNRLILSGPNVPELTSVPNHFPAGSKDEVLAVLKAARAVVYASLLNFYGEAPILDNIDFPENVVNSSTEAIYNLIKADVDAVIPVLVDKQMTGVGLSADAARVVLARAALHQKKYEKVLEVCGQLINSSRYMLVGDTSQLKSNATNAEVIWNRIYGQSANEVPTYFTGRAFTPAIRYSEALLMYAEASIETGNLAQATQTLNTLCVRRGVSQVGSGSNQVALKSKLQEVWKRELYREGSRFSSLIRWGTAESMLGPLGYQGYKGLMPIPSGIIALYPGIQQHAGY